MLLPITLYKFYSRQSNVFEHVVPMRFEKVATGEQVDSNGRNKL